MTEPKLIADEMAAGVAAATAKLNELVPAWEQAFISNKDEILQQLVAAVVTAVDGVRDGVVREKEH